MAAPWMARSSTPQKTESALPAPSGPVSCQAGSAVVRGHADVGDAPTGLLRGTRRAGWTRFRLGVADLVGRRLITRRSSILGRKRSLILSHHVACSFIAKPDRAKALDRRLTTSVRILRFGTPLTGQHRWLQLVASLGALSGRDVLPPVRTKGVLSMPAADAEGGAVVQQDGHRVPPSARALGRQADVVQRASMITALFRAVPTLHPAGVAAPGRVPPVGSGRTMSISAPAPGPGLDGVAARASLPLKKTATVLPALATEFRSRTAMSVASGRRTGVALVVASPANAAVLASAATPVEPGQVVASGGMPGSVVPPGRPPAGPSARVTAGAAALGMVVARPPTAMAGGVAPPVPPVEASELLPDGSPTLAGAGVPPALAAATGAPAVQVGAAAGLHRIAPLPASNALVPLSRRSATPAVVAGRPAAIGQLHGQVVPLPPSRRPPAGRVEAAVSSAWGDHRDAGLSNGRGDGANMPPLIVNLTGDVVIDGRRLGRITATSQAREASLPAYGPSRVNLRAVPLYSGAQVPG